MKWYDFYSVFMCQICFNESQKLVFHYLLMKNELVNQHAIYVHTCKTLNHLS